MLKRADLRPHDLLPAAQGSKMWAARMQNDWACELQAALSEHLIAFAQYARRTSQSPNRLDRVMHGSLVLRVTDIAAFELFEPAEP
jgi:hypothetical protein